jgi:glycosyltransferase involved in cell wall biosynthesis
LPTFPRLLLIAERFAPDVGGVARSAARTADALAMLGVEVHVLSWTRTLPAGQIDTHVVKRSNAADVVVHRLGLFANLDYSLQHTLTLLETLHRRHPFAGTWGHYLFPAGFVSVLFAGSVGIPATVSARGNDVDMLMFPPGDFARLLWTLERARVISAVSSDLARKIHLLTNAGQPVHVVPNSVDPELFHARAPDESLRASLGISPEETVLCFSGELRQKKGLAALLTAFLEVRAARPTCLLVIGEVRVRDQAALASFSAEHPESRARLIVTGHLEDPREVARHLRLCDIFLQPSLWDGLPNSVLEAMASERLVIASDAGGIPEAIEHGRSGFLVPRTELHRLGEAIQEVLSLPEEQRRSITNAARRRICDNFSPAREAAELRTILAHLWPTNEAIER